MKDKLNNMPDVGCSNTPSGKSLKNIFTSIDYFSFRFDTSYENNLATFKPLLELLTYDIEYGFTGVKGKNGYTDGLEIGRGITLYYGGEITMNREGNLTSYLEMKGEGCREFESIASFKNWHNPKPLDDYWTELFEVCITTGGKCTRIDLPVDDCEGLINISTIKEKIKNKEYTTRMKKIEEMASYEDDDSGKVFVDGLPDVVSTIESKHKGYSVTLGNRTHIQLCIYDKKAEQQNKGRPVKYKSWVRYESRFYHDNADDAFKQLFYSVKYHASSEFIIGCLAAIFQLKANNKNAKVNRSRNPIDPNYALLISKKGEAKMFKSPTNINELDDNTFWFIKSASKTFLKIIAAMNKMGIHSAEVLTALIHKCANKMDESDLKTINQYLRKNKIQEFSSLKELKQFLRLRNSFVDELHDPTLNLIIKKKSSKELKEEDEEDDG